MPEGTACDALDDSRNDMAEIAVEYGYRYTPRLRVDLSGYPDCRPESFEAFQTVVVGTKEDTDISIKSPFVE